MADAVEGVPNDAHCADRMPTWTRTRDPVAGADPGADADAGADPDPDPVAQEGAAATRAPLGATPGVGAQALVSVRG
jgi:hypothetical protein